MYEYYPSFSKILTKQSCLYMQIVLYSIRNMANYSNIIILKEKKKQPLYICFMYKHYCQGAPWSSLCDVCVHRSFYMIWLITRSLPYIKMNVYTSLSVMYQFALSSSIVINRKFYVYPIFWLPWKLSGYY